MSNDKVVYMPEVVYSPGRFRTQKNNGSQADMRRAAAIAITTLLALSAAGQSDTYISSAEKPKSITYIQKSSYPVKESKMYQIEKNGQIIDLRETSDGTFVDVKKEKKKDKSELGLLLALSGLIMTMTGFAYTTANLYNANKSQCSKPWGRLRYDEFAETRLNADIEDKEAERKRTGVV